MCAIAIVCSWRHGHVNGQGRFPALEGNGTRHANSAFLTKVATLWSDWLLRGRGNIWGFYLGPAGHVFEEAY